MPASATREEASQRRRAVILDAALTCFDDKGVVATTMDDIRLAAEVSVGSMYHHFANKEAVAAALYVRLIGRYQASALAAVDRRASPKAQIKATIAHHITWALENQPATRFLLEHRGPDVRSLSDPEVGRMNQELEARLQEWLDEEARRGRLQRVAADIYLSIVVGPAQSFVRHWILGLTETPPEEAIKVLSEAAWRALRVNRATRV